MKSKLAFLAVCGCGSFAGGVVADAVFRSPGNATARPPLPPVPAQVSAEFDPQPAALSDRFQATIRKVSPAVVAVDAVKPPQSDPTAKGKPVEESGSGVMVKFPGLRGAVAITNNHVVGAAEPAKVYVTLSDGRIVQPSKIWADAESDITLLHLDDDTLPTINRV